MANKTLTLIFSLLRRFILKITSPINSEDHSFCKHVKRLAVRLLSDSKLSRSARVLESVKTLINIHKEKHKGNHDRSSGFISGKAHMSLYIKTHVSYTKLSCFKLFKLLLHVF